MSTTDPYRSRPAAYAGVTVAVLAVICGAIAIASGPRAGLAAAALLLGLPLAGALVLAAVILSLDRVRTARLRRTAPGLRIRIRYADCPQPALVLTDTPRPHCHLCLGDGSWDEPWSTYGDVQTTYCDCWTPWRRTLLPIPRRAATWYAQLTARRASTGGFSDEPPF
jgi:membrane protein implicated in regulation of membrane protease activity